MTSILFPGQDYGAPQGDWFAARPSVSRMLVSCRKPSIGAMSVTALEVARKMACRSWWSHGRKLTGVPLNAAS